MSALTYSERPAAGEPTGMLVLHHGRGADERDMLALAEALDPDHGLYIVAPRAPLTLAGWPGYHWYIVPRVGHPDPQTFFAAYEQLAHLHDTLWAQTGIPVERTVLGGFSMGTAMSFALGLGEDRPTPAGILAFSGFIPTVPGWQAAIARRSSLRIFIAHGSADNVIEVGFSRQARRQLEAGGLDVEYHEWHGAHQIAAEHTDAAAGWLTTTLTEAGR